MKLKVYLLTLISLLSVLGARAYDSSVNGIAYNKDFRNIKDDVVPPVPDKGTLYDFEQDGWYFKKVSENTVELSPISYTQDSSSGELVYQGQGQDYGSIYIPNYAYDNVGNIYDVIGIGAHAFEGSEITTLNVDLSTNYKYIGDCAFSNCRNLIAANIPTSVESIGENAFYGCKSLKYVGLGVTNYSPDGIERQMTIKEGAFCNTPELAGIFVSNINYSLPLSDAFDPDNVVTQNRIFYIQSDFMSNAQSVFSRYNHAEYGSFRDCSAVYTGQAPEFHPEFVSNLGSGVNYSLGEVTPPYEVNAGNGASSAFVNFYLPYPYFMTFSIVVVYNYTITKAPLSLNVKNCSRVYGEENPKFEIEVKGYVNGENEEIFSTLPMIVNGIADWAPELPTQASPIGEYELVAMADLKYPQNYEISGSIHGTLTITPAPLEIAAPTLTREYGQPNPEIELAYTGFKNNETEDVLSAKPSITLEATTYSPVGEYPITISGAEAANYDISYRPGKLIITKANQSLSWEQTFDKVRIGDEMELDAVSSSGLPIKYVSSNSDIVLINGNYAKFLAEGWAEITAMQEGDENYFAASSISKRIDVSPMVDIEEIIVNKKQISLSVGDTYQLTATIKPDNATHSELSWRSENSDIASVDDTGLVKAIGKGTTKIIVESTYNPDIKTECNVMVDVNSNIDGIYSDAGIRFVVQNNCLHIYNVSDNTQINIYSPDGILIYSGIETHIPLSSGIYFVKVGNIVKKIAL